MRSSRISCQRSNLEASCLAFLTEAIKTPRGRCRGQDARHTPSPQTTNEVLTVKELGKLLRVQSITIYKLIRQDKIPRFRVGIEWRFRTDAVCDGWRKSLAPPSR